MKQVTDEQITEIISKRPTCRAHYTSDQMEAVAREVLALAAEPGIDRAGTWWKDIGNGRFYGPVTQMIDNIWHGGNMGDPNNALFREMDIEAGIVVRIPPPPEGEDLDDGAVWFNVGDSFKGWECREPEQDEPYYTWNGILVPDDSHWYGACGKPDVDRRRWIPPKPDLVKTPWPVGLFEVAFFGMGVANSSREYMVRDANQTVICQGCTYVEAKAIAFALNMLPECLGWMKASIHTGNLTTQRDELLALADKFNMPEGEKE